MKTTTRHLAFLRGVNVGGKNKLPMAALAKIFSDAGCDDVATYIQSGNVIFSAASSALPQLPARIAKAIEKQFGFQSPVVVRSHAELAQVPKRNPFETTEAVRVAFLADAPNAAAIRALDPNRSPPDRFVVSGREIYLHLPNGGGRSKLTNAYFDRGLATVSTLRNWNTVTKLIELASK